MTAKYGSELPMLQNSCARYIQEVTLVGEPKQTSLLWLYGFYLVQDLNQFSEQL